MQINTNDWYSKMYNLTKEYTSVKSTSYKKLIKKHYENQKNEGSVFVNESSEKKALSKIKADADYLTKEAGRLSSKGKNFVFGQVDGNYDSELIQSTVKSFAEGYNALVKSSVKTENTGVLKKTLSMVTTTKAFKESLAKVGITIESDNTMSIDEEKLKNASDAQLKRLFSGGNSFGGQIMKKAAGIAAVSQFASLYTKDGSMSGTSDNVFNRYY